MDDTNDKPISRLPVDLADMGKRLRAARAIAGYERMTDLAADIEEISGVTISARTLYAIERGEQMPSYEQLICILSALPEAQQREFIEASIRPDLFARLWCAKA